MGPSSTIQILQGISERGERTPVSMDPHPSSIRSRPKEATAGGDHGLVQHPRRRSTAETQSGPLLRTRSSWNPLIRQFHVCSFLCRPFTNSLCRVGNCVALDCEMVGTGKRGSVSMVGRCSIVDHRGNVLYDTFVAPQNEVTDYRTPFSGIRKADLVGGKCACVCTHNI